MYAIIGITGMVGGIDVSRMSKLIRRPTTINSFVSVTARLTLTSTR